MRFCCGRRCRGEPSVSNTIGRLLASLGIVDYTVLHLPREADERLMAEIVALEEDKKMPYIEIWQLWPEAATVKSRPKSSIVTAHKQAKLTQKELADRVGISQTAVHKLECSRSKSSQRTVTIALTCGVDPIWLETGQGEMALVGGLPGMTPKDP